MLAAYFASIIYAWFMPSTSLRNTPLIIFAFAIGAAVGMVGLWKTSPLDVPWYVLLVYAA